MRRFCFLLLCIPLFLSPLVSVAQDEIVTDRPDATESAVSIPLKSVQLELGFTYGHEEGGKTITTPEYLVRLGLLKNFEFRVESSFDQNLDPHSFSKSDINTGFKYQFIGKEKFNFAFLGYATFPQGSRGALTYLGKLLVSYDLSESAQIGVNFGATGLDFKGQGAWSYTISWGQGLTDKLGFFMEHFADLDFNTGYFSYIDGGLTYLLKPRFQLDVKAGVETQYFEGFFVGAGLSTRLFN